MATLDPVIFEKYAIISTAAYPNQAVPLGMEFLAANAPSTTGFAATAFRDTTTGEIVIAIRQVGEAWPPSPEPTQ
ncbi:MAG: hypothetical protein OEV73_08545 [Desulfobulbaceae bacterium]|nr:hypothetical protein [Desulfobulbaceae bacterium]